MSQSAFTGNVSRPFSLLRGAAISGLAVGLICAAAMGEDKVELKPLRVGASLYFGQMFNINDSLQELPAFNPTVTLPYTSLWMIQEATVNDRLDFNLGIAGSFFYPFPEEITAGWTSYRTGGVAIAQANGTYKFGDLTDPWLKLSVGQQGYKYNPSAKNFGEYLFRSEAYPTTVRTGDWGAIDNAASGIWGIAAKGKFLDGLITNDFLVTMADERAPLHDINFTDIVSLNLGKVFQIGGGVMLNRFISIDRDLTSPRTAESGWFTWTAADQAKLSAYLKTQTDKDPAFVSNSAKFKKKFYDPASGAETMIVDTSLEVGKTYWAGSKRPLVKYLATSVDASDSAFNLAGISKRSSVEYVDAKTIFLMGRFNFDPKPLLGMEESMSPGDLVLYGETSVIGLDNYPVYYRSTSERMPMMFGFNLPTFRLLDYLTLEMEYWKNPHLNSDYIPAFQRALRPKSTNGADGEIPDIADPHDDKRGDAGAVVNQTEDDLKWTVTAKKSFGVWNIAAQYGTDHFRPVTNVFRPALTDPQQTKDAKYYMIRLQVNL